MMSKIARALGRAKVPAPGYMLKHPVKGTKKLMASCGSRSMLRGPTAFALGAAVALPIAYLAVRRARG